MANEEWRFEPVVYYDQKYQHYVISKYYEAWLLYLSEESITEFLNRLTEDLNQQINVTKRLKGIGVEYE